METQPRPVRKRRLAGSARKKRAGKKKPSADAPQASGEAVAVTAKKPRKRKQKIELQVIDKVLKRYKKQAGDENFTVSTAEVAKLIQLKQEIGGSQEEFADIDLQFPGVPCLNTDSGS